EWVKDQRNLYCGPVDCRCRDSDESRLQPGRLSCDQFAELVGNAFVGESINALEIDPAGGPLFACLAVDIFALLDVNDTLSPDCGCPIERNARAEILSPD